MILKNIIEYKVTVLQIGSIIKDKNSISKMINPNNDINKNIIYQIKNYYKKRVERILKPKNKIELILFDSNLIGNNFSYSRLELTFLLSIQTGFGITDTEYLINDNITDCDISNRLVKNYQDNININLNYRKSKLDKIYL